MSGRALVIALATGAAIILSAPVAQQLFTEAAVRWPGQFRVLGVSATAIPLAVAVLIAVSRIRDRRGPRYLALGLSVAIAAGYVYAGGLSFGESFHFVEYGLLAVLLYRAWRPTTASRRRDGSIVLLPLVIGILIGTLDEWFQWAVPIRAGEARDVALNGMAVACGLLFSLAINPPDRLTWALRPESLPRVSGWTAAAVALFGLFFQTVHLGHRISDGERREFRSRFSAAELAVASKDRSAKWRVSPPAPPRRFSWEDHYLTEGLWHVQRRNHAWNAGDAVGAWHENRILESFYAPVLDVAASSGVGIHRWPPPQRAHAEASAAADARPYLSEANPFPLYAWPRTIVWTAHAMLLLTIVTLLGLVPQAGMDDSP